MNTLLQHLHTHSSAPLGHTFIIGAGDGSQLPQWRELHSEYLHLAEAHPQQAKSLSQRTQGHAQESVFEGAITPEAQQNATLHVLTLPHYSSTQAPSALQDFLPNVREHSTETVAAQRLETWLSQTALDPSATHTLVLNAPGQGHALLCATASEVIQAFSWIIVSTAEEALYENDVDSATLDTTLTQLGYARVLEDDSAVYPTVTRLYQRQPAVIERLTLIKERDALASANAKLTTEQQEQAKRLESLNDKITEYETLLKDNAQQLNEAATALRETDAELQERTQERDVARKQTDDTKKALDEKTKQLTECDKQLEEARANAHDEATQHAQALENAQKQLAEHDEQFKQRTQERDAARKQSEEHKKSLEEKSKLLSERIEQLSEKDKALNAANEQLAQRTQERDQAKQALDAAKKQDGEHKKALEEKAKQLAERDKQLEEAQATAQDEATQHAQALENAQKQLAERDEQFKQRTQERDAARKQSEEHKKSLDEKSKQLSERDEQLSGKDKALNAAKEQLAQRTQERDQSNQALDAAKKQGDEHKKALEEKAKQLAERDQQLEEARATAKSEQEAGVIAKSEATKQSQALEEANKQIEALTQQLASKENSLHNTEERFSSLESKLDQLFGEQRSYIQQTSNALGQHVTRSARQQRDEQALTHYLHHGQRPISTEFAPNFAIALLERRDTQRYDVMVVLGSTPITELLAQAVINEGRHQPRLTAQSQAKNGKDVQQFVAPSQDDLPQAVISLAHKKSICKTLKQRLAANHSQEAVSVVHAPWVEAGTQGALFYACETTLQRLNQWLEEDAKVLVIVGNALAEANHSRIAALPQLLQHLPTQTLDVVVEGASYAQESELKAEWETLLNARQREVEWLHIPTAIGLRIEG
ncbi:hypothetical protein [Vreelandella salicampi]|uniref:Uncharacterized protein n=1 Tax=Vreelandella salicampi TaxID=1449798 RepID=A0A7Z0LK06_9GAMM|nr:hypothetical protein [Halomonas salicampi]NYS60332.1 hypothetical protein [Halomonas salicampi]